LRNVKKVRVNKLLTRKEEGGYMKNRRGKKERVLSEKMGTETRKKGDEVHTGDRTVKKGLVIM